MSKKNSLLVNNDLPSLLSLASSLSARSFSHLNVDSINDLPSSVSSSTEEVTHTREIERLRTETAETIIDPTDSPLTQTCVNNENTPQLNFGDETITEDNNRYSEEFRNKETHIFVLSQSGKPIFSRYGSDSQIAAFIGVMQALVSFVQTNDDKLRVMVAGNHNFVFMVREHMILVAVSQSSFVPSQLRNLLNYVYHQILSILTFRTISNAFKKQPGLDLRRLLVGTDRYLNGMIDYMERDMGPLLNAVICVPMQATLRHALLNTISQAIKINDLVFAILLLDDKLVGVVRRKEHQPQPMDLHLILNLIRNSSYFKTQICWLPLCLPKFDPDGFFYAHISYLCSGLSLVLLTVNPEHFDILQQSQYKTKELMESNGLFEKLKQIYSVEELLHSFKLTEVKHFIYKMRNANQIISYSKEISDEKEILRQYLRFHHLIHITERPAKLVYQCTESETFFAWQTMNFELYATLNEVFNKRKVMEIINKLLDAINKQRNRLFITISPTF